MSFYFEQHLSLRQSLALLVNLYVQERHCFERADFYTIDKYHLIMSEDVKASTHAAVSTLHGHSLLLAITLILIDRITSATKYCSLYFYP